MIYHVHFKNKFNKITGKTENEKYYPINLTKLEEKHLIHVLLFSLLMEILDPLLHLYLQ